MAKYDLAIIGSGPGGYVAAIRAAQWGLKTVVIEKDSFLGGTCLHVGCIPTKVFLHHADIYDHFKRAEEFGFEVKDVKINWPAILARKDKIVKKHAGGIGALFKKNKVESITGWGRIAGPGRVAVEKDGKTTEIETTYTMLATGSEARSLPGVEIDGKIVLTNREILGLQEIPKSMIVVGCGAVGVEFASIFKTFGTDVTLLEALPRVVPLEDEEISAELEKILRKKGMKIELEAKVESVKKDAKGATVTYKDKTGKSQTISAEKVLIAVGRRPLTENIGLEKTKAKLDRGFIETNAFLETAEPKLYAIGDIVAGQPQLAHAASMEGIIAVGRMAGKEVLAVRPQALPQRDLLRAAGRVDWLYGEAGARSGFRREGRQIPVPRQQQSHDSRPARRLHQSGCRCEIRRNTRRPRDRTARNGNYRRTCSRARPRSHAGRHGRNDSRAPDRVGSDGRCIQFRPRAFD